MLRSITAMTARRGPPGWTPSPDRNTAGPFRVPLPPDPLLVVRGVHEGPVPQPARRPTTSSSRVVGPVVGRIWARATQPEPSRKAPTASGRRRTGPRAVASPTQASAATRCRHHRGGVALARSLSVGTLIIAPADGRSRSALAVAVWHARREAGRHRSRRWELPPARGGRAGGGGVRRGFGSPRPGLSAARAAGLAEADFTAATRARRGAGSCRYGSTGGKEVIVTASLLPATTTRPDTPGARREGAEVLPGEGATAGADPAMAPGTPVPPERELARGTRRPGRPCGRRLPSS